MSLRRTAYFNGIAFDELGLIITRRPVPPVRANKRKTISIPDGPVIIDDTKTKDPVQFSIECTLTEPEKLRLIYAMVQDDGILILPYEQDKYYYGTLTVSTPENIIMYWNKITFTMTAEPYAYAVDNADIVCELATSNWWKWTRVTNNGTADCLPVYQVQASDSENFDITTWKVNSDDSMEQIAGCRVHLNGAETITINTENRIVLDSQNRIILDRVEETFADLKLTPGLCEIRVSNCEALTIRKNERWY